MQDRMHKLAAKCRRGEDNIVRKKLPKKKQVYKIYIEDLVDADQTFSMLMGDDVQARKAFIQENAREANLDI